MAVKEKLARIARIWSAANQSSFSHWSNVIMQLSFLEIGVDRDHAHFLIQSVPTYSPTRIVQTVKSVTAREVLANAPAVKQKLWGGEFWGKGYFANTVGQHGSEKVIAAYVKGQGGESTYVSYRKDRWTLDCFDQMPRSLLRGFLLRECVRSHAA
jgi:REP element-mobilizing transposase RayT